MNPFAGLSRRPPEGGFESLVRPHLERLYRLAYRFTGSPTDAEDLVQSLLVKLIPQESRLKEVDDLAPWLSRSLMNLYLNLKRRPNLVAYEADLPEGAADIMMQIVDETTESPELAAERAFSGQRLAAALQRLPEDQRALIGWHDVEGYTLEELASEKDIPIGTLKSRLHRARARMRELLAEPRETVHPRVRLIRART